MKTIKIYESNLKKIREYSAEENRKELLEQYEYIKENTLGYLVDEDITALWIQFIHSILLEAEVAEVLTEDIKNKYIELSYEVEKNFNEKRELEPILFEHEFDYVIISEEEEIIEQEIEHKKQEMERKKQDESINKKIDEFIENKINNFEEQKFIDFDLSFEEQIFNMLKLPYISQETLNKLKNFINSKENENKEESDDSYNKASKVLYRKALEVMIEHILTLEEEEKNKKFNEVKRIVSDTLFNLSTINVSDEWKIKNIVFDYRMMSINTEAAIKSLRMTINSNKYSEYDEKIMKHIEDLTKINNDIREKMKNNQMVLEKKREEIQMKKDEIINIGLEKLKNY